MIEFTESHLLNTSHRLISECDISCHHLIHKEIRQNVIPSKPLIINRFKCLSIESFLIINFVIIFPKIESIITEIFAEFLLKSR